jgi:hypothetical protein
LRNIDESQQITIPGGVKKGVRVLLGCDPAQNVPGGHYGVMLYCEGTLIASYVTHELSIENRKEDHFGMYSGSDKMGCSRMQLDHTPAGFR